MENLDRIGQRFHGYIGSAYSRKDARSMISNASISSATPALPGTFDIYASTCEAVLTRDMSARRRSLTLEGGR